MNSAALKHSDHNEQEETEQTCDCGSKSKENFLSHLFCDFVIYDLEIMIPLSHKMLAEMQFVITEEQEKILQFLCFTAETALY